MKSSSSLLTRWVEETKTKWDKIKSHLSSSDRRQKSESDSPRLESQQPAHIGNNENEPDRDNDDNFSSGALSEVAAPEPVQRFSPEEYARRPSLEKRLSDRSKSAHDDNYDIYENLSELASPEPIEKTSESEAARRPSLEQNLAYSRSH